jgi:hypothetical protein
LQPTNKVSDLGFVWEVRISSVLLEVLEVLVLVVLVLVLVVVLLLLLLLLLGGRDGLDNGWQYVVVVEGGLYG